MRLNFWLFKRVSIGYTPAMKDAGLRIRVQRELRQAFIEACKEDDKSAAQVLREFMRDYVKDKVARAGRSADDEAIDVMKNR